jgi:hypothetical protein
MQIAPSMARKAKATSAVNAGNKIELTTVAFTMTERRYKTDEELQATDRQFVLQGSYRR